MAPPRLTSFQRLSLETHCAQYLLKYRSSSDAAPFPKTRAEHNLLYHEIENIIQLYRVDYYVEYLADDTRRTELLNQIVDLAGQYGSRQSFADIKKFLNARRRGRPPGTGNELLKRAYCEFAVVQEIFKIIFGRGNFSLSVRFAVRLHSLDFNGDVAEIERQLERKLRR